MRKMARAFCCFLLRPSIFILMLMLPDCCRCLRALLEQTTAFKCLDTFTGERPDDRAHRHPHHHALPRASSWARFWGLAVTIEPIRIALGDPEFDGLRHDFDTASRRDPEYRKKIRSTFVPLEPCKTNCGVVPAR